MFTMQFFISEENIAQYIENLREKKLAGSTIEKYERDIRAFAYFLNGAEITKQAALNWQNVLLETRAVTSINAAITAINGYFDYFKLGIKI